MVIKHASRKDIAALTAVETACFPPAEAATEKEFIDRVQYYGNHFWLLYEGDKLLAFVDGFVTDEPDLTDVMYEDAAQRAGRVADDLRRQHAAGVPQARLCGAAAPPGRCRCPAAGPQGACADLQGAAAPLLRKIRVSG